MTTTEKKILYKEDLMEILDCSEYVALSIMRKTGADFRVGKRIAIPAQALDLFIQGKRYETPEAYLGIETR